MGKEVDNNDARITAKAGGFGKRKQSNDEEIKTLLTSLSLRNMEIAINVTQGEPTGAMEDPLEDLKNLKQESILQDCMDSLEQLYSKAGIQEGEGLSYFLSGLVDELQISVRQLLADDPHNSEYVDMEKELNEVIALTEELLATAKQNEISGSDIGPETSASPGLHQPKDSVGMSSGHDKFPVGAKVQAVWSEDGDWYDATIEALTPNGYYVSYDGWGNKEEVDPANVRPVEFNALLEAERDAEATKQAIKRKIAQAAFVDFESRSLPSKLRINADDPEDVKSAKRKKIHAFKSKVRFEQLEVAQNKRQNAWQQFQTTKGSSKKVGFFSGRKRESIFKSPDDPNGKVGVTGSGKGLTEFQKREKHLHLKGGTVETDD
ncbi:hypothetical protein GH714_007233 [Hevea brasiliensis]|uniref:Survival of motor neuron-related-splicing factor 30 n=1 Tax=Hevea brasiliensis TaxID=3981 RepID=A0A6A6L1G3_HEVBR|nr:hypothetical protein GH714_007233 [Hevea brasiliensis]